MAKDKDIRKLLADIFDSLPSAVFLKDSQSRFVYVNKELADMLAVAPDQLIGMRDENFYPSAEDVEKYRNDDLHVFSTGKQIRTTERFTSPSGEPRILRTVKRLFSDPETHDPMLLGVVTDITSIQASYEAAKSELEEKEKQLRMADEQLAEIERQSPASSGRPYAFVSYRHSNEAHVAWVGSFVRDLVEIHGVPCMLDQFDVSYGESLQAFMQRIKTEATHVLMIITDESVDAVEGGSGGFAFEAELAAALRDEGKLSLIPVMRSGSRIPAYVRSHLYVDFRNDEYYREMLRRLAESISGNDVRPVLNSRKHERD